MKPVLRDLLGVAAIVGLFGGFWVHQSRYYEGWWTGDGTYYQRVNIPEPEIIRVASLGYENLVADLLVLQAVQAYGARWTVVVDESLPGADQVDRNQPIFDYFDVITELDPHFVGVYEFANLVLSDDREDHEKGIAILRKGLRNNPEEWNLAYLGMYTAMWGMDDEDIAREFLRAAKAIPGTPDHVLRMEEYIERQAGRYIAAFQVNLGQLLQYIDRESEVEIDVARRKFDLIIDGWMRYELATAAQKFLEAEGRHPESIEELMVEPYRPDFEGPLPARLYAMIDGLLQAGQDLAPNREELQQRTLARIQGLPPDPNGFWYYIDPYAQKALLDGTLTPPSDKLTDQFLYITSFKNASMTIGEVENSTGRFIEQYVRDEGEPPTTEFLFDRLGPDGYGGHFTYNPDAILNDKGDRGPLFQSTTNWRIYNNEERRMGMSGDPSEWPRRPITVDLDAPPYLTTFPSLWDYEEDITWALSVGMIPGVRLRDQPAEVTSQFQDLLQLSTVPPPDPSAQPK